MESMKLWDEEDKVEFEKKLKSLLNVGLNSDNFDNIESNMQEPFDQLVETLEGQNDQLSVPYYVISKTVFMLEDTDGMDYFILSFKNLIRKYIITSQNKVINRKLIKIVSHIELSNTQKESLYQNQMQQISELSNGQNQLVGSYEEMEERFRYQFTRTEEKLSEKMDKFYTSFISVLGIFISISFSLFGAATLLKNIFTISTENGFDVSAQVIGTNVLLAGFATILIYLLIVGLLQGIGSLAHKHYFFSIRKLFVIVSVAGGVIISGFIYSHSTLSWSHLIFLVCSLSLYGIVCLIIFAIGRPVKEWLIHCADRKRKY
ncbi:hypothetical protein DWV05_04790 [Weissella thailandensis]|uniref:Uncharacterized protein n=2 Tax=Weissella thailandensis TaxID=89061 RepID=A0ABX9I4L2_9LACO|nr:hypothetical protein DWV05_04790 [Weissella thailandensis]